MRKVNYKSDFTVRLTFRECGADGVAGSAVPPYDWVARFRTPASARQMVASSIGGVLKGCVRDGDGYIVVFNAYNTYAEQCKAEAKQLLTKQAGEE